MASSQPIIRQTRFLYIIPQFLLIAFFTYFFSLIDASDPLLNAAFTYLIISLGMKMMIPLYHRKGMRYYKKKEYENAIREFQKSYDFFIRHKWIDTYRYLTLLSSSQISYIEMSLVNMAFCYGQIGDGVKAKELYLKTLSLFPDSEMAKSALKMYQAFKVI